MVDEELEIDNTVFPVHVARSRTAWDSERVPIITSRREGRACG